MAAANAPPTRRAVNFRPMRNSPIRVLLLCRFVVLLVLVLFSWSCFVGFEPLWPTRLRDNLPHRSAPCHHRGSLIRPCVDHGPISGIGRFIPRQNALSPC